MLAGAAGPTPPLRHRRRGGPGGNSTALQEVIVTAQKRRRRSRRCPPACRPWARRGSNSCTSQDFNDYIKFLPSVSYQSLGPGSSNVYIRGVAADNQANTPAPCPAIGTYLDEQPITTIGGALDIHVYDIARVEALAGPQGTLYGASSVAGTIRIITNKPEIGRFSAGYDIEGDKYPPAAAAARVEGFVNIPVERQDRRTPGRLGRARRRLHRQRLGTRTYSDDQDHGDAPSSPLYGQCPRTAQPRTPT